MPIKADADGPIAVIGLGYVGLPLAYQLASHYRVIGYDVSVSTVAALRAGRDPNGEIMDLSKSGRHIEYTSDPNDIRYCRVFIVAVPTDITDSKVPDLGPLKDASETIGRSLKPGDLVIYESTVYPGCTEEFCIPIVERTSGLIAGTHFKFGYSPERINPGDNQHKLASTIKVVSGSDDDALATVELIYSKVVPAGLHRAQSIKVAEASKVVENSQRDLNISLMNELAILFDRLNIDTSQVLEAAGTKFNFVKAYPGLVGGHCICVDPYYLLHKAREVGVEPEVIAAGRRVNDRMPAWIAKKVIVSVSQNDKPLSAVRVLVLGITFKANVRDLRNSKIYDLTQELSEYGMAIEVHDTIAEAKEVKTRFGINLKQPTGVYDVVIVAVKHDAFAMYDEQWYDQYLTEDSFVFDLVGACDWGYNLKGHYWRL